MAKARRTEETGGLAYEIRDDTVLPYQPLQFLKQQISYIIL